MNHLCEQACEILKRTHDGEDLSPSDLRLVQEAVNGNLTPAGKVAFSDLYAQVLSGEYRRPWLHGVEHLTIRHNGDVYWRDVRVENFTYFDDDDTREYLARYAQSLGRVFGQHEAAGLPVQGHVSELRHEAYEASKEKAP